MPPHRRCLWLLRCGSGRSEGKIRGEGQKVTSTKGDDKLSGETVGFLGESLRWGFDIKFSSHLQFPLNGWGLYGSLLLAPITLQVAMMAALPRYCILNWFNPAAREDTVFPKQTADSTLCCLSVSGPQMCIPILMPPNSRGYRSGFQNDPVRDPAPLLPNIWPK